MMTDCGTTTAPKLLETPLNALHREMGGQMVAFAGYEMPVQFPMGIKGEHLHCRQKAGLFDVSHMGQAMLDPINPEDDIARLFEELVPGAIATLKPGQMRYSLLLDDTGGILDDLMITRRADRENGLFIVVNAGPRLGDFAHIRSRLAGRARLSLCDDRALLALQGPDASDVLAAIIPACRDLLFMEALWTSLDGLDLIISRSGYTGEDGFEISLPAAHAESFARRLLADERVAPIGLGARDSLRLEAGLCLYGQDLSPEITPVEADLLWAIPKARRDRADFPGAGRILGQIAEGPARKRVGISPDDRTIARDGTAIYSPDGTQKLGIITSGGFGPTVNAPVAMGLIDAKAATPGTDIALMVRGKLRKAHVKALPFVTQNYVRKSSKPKQG
ncbi:aminomethyltransferase [Iodidimonas nitroreducens]|uniref:aminomethyltransferase n=1 Tax=Iodidimonas nitroreducens TaxID=1236968 RepID=A0A5A7N6B3_9PROT|nr:glycine cleavage system aminomethyltransferase GcvT [Iodidimonas nitroreducens]GER03863.1 aminomethyltransferase [Iodidimonas nitroreducens]